VFEDLFGGWDRFPEGGWDRFLKGGVDLAVDGGVRISVVREPLPCDLGLSGELDELVAGIPVKCSRKFSICEGVIPRVSVWVEIWRVCMCGNPVFAASNMFGSSSMSSVVAWERVCKIASRSSFLSVGTSCPWL